MRHNAWFKGHFSRKSGAASDGHVSAKSLAEFLERERLVFTLLGALGGGKDCQKKY